MISSTSTPTPTPTPTPPPRPLTSSRLRRRSDNHPSSHSSPLASTPSRMQDGLMGGLRERNEEELKRASRDELESALMVEWSNREQMSSQLIELEDSNNQLTKATIEKGNMLSSLSLRMSSSEYEQSRLEEALASREVVLEKLRTAIKDLEREKKELGRRYDEQETSFETERRAFALSEEHLRFSLVASQNKLQDVTAAMRDKRSVSESTTEVSAATPLQPPNEDARTQPLTVLLEELSEAQLEISHLQTTNAALTAQDKAMTRELHMLKEDFGTLRDQNESYEILLRERTMDGGMMFDEEPSNAMDRIGEEIAEEDVQTIDALIAENKALKDSSKALSLYCSKILDRIISQPGFEHILSTDYSDSTSGVKVIPPARRTKDTTQLPLPAVIEPQAPVTAAGSPLAPIPAASSKRRSIMRPLSMFIPAMSPNTPSPAVTSDESPSEKRAHRGMSIDWPSFGGFASTSSSGSTPLQELPTASTPPIKLNTKPTKQRIVYYEEDEDDRRERERLATTMKLMGITSPSNDVPATTVRGSEDLLTPHSSTSLRPSISRSKTAPTPSASLPTPSRSSSSLSRFSFFRGKTGLIASSPLSPEIDKLDPDQEITEDIAAAALKGFDDRERQQLARLGKGIASGSFTSPSSDLSDRIALRRRASANQARSPSRSPNDFGMSLQEEKSGHVKDSSISTLWSFGENESAGGSPDPMSGV